MEDELMEKPAMKVPRSQNGAAAKPAQDHGTLFK